jgi:hypothetical protein
METAAPALYVYCLGSASLSLHPYIFTSFAAAWRAACAHAAQHCPDFRGPDLAFTALTPQECWEEHELNRIAVPVAARMWTVAEWRGDCARFGYVRIVQLDGSGGSASSAAAPAACPAAPPA